MPSRKKNGRKGSNQRVAGTLMTDWLAVAFGADGIADGEGAAGQDLTFSGPMKTMMADFACCYIFLDEGPDKDGRPLVPDCKYSSS